MNYKQHRQHRKAVIQYPHTHDGYTWTHPKSLTSVGRVGKMSRQMFRLMESFWDRQTPF